MLAKVLLGFLLFLATVCVLSSSKASAESSEQFPATGKQLESFVPTGWHIARTHHDHESQACGDLNADDVEDCVLTINPADGQSIKLSLLILQGRTGGGYSLVAQSEFEYTVPYLKIENGILHIDWSWAGIGRGQNSRSIKVRREAASQRFLIIGEDGDEYDSIDGRGEVWSINYLTGQRITQSYRVGPNGKRIVDKASKESFTKQMRTVQQLADVLSPVDERDAKSNDDSDETGRPPWNHPKKRLFPDAGN